MLANLRKIERKQMNTTAIKLNGKKNQAEAGKSVSLSISITTIALPSF